MITLALTAVIESRRVVENRRSARPRNPVGHVAHDCATLSCRRRRFARVRTCRTEQASLLRRRRREREARARRGAPTVSLDRWPCRRKRSLRTRSSTSVLRRVESTRRARSPWLSVSRSRQWQSHTARRDTASEFCQGGAIASIRPRARSSSSKYSRSADRRRTGVDTAKHLDAVLERGC